MGSTPMTLRCAKCRKGREYDSRRLFYDNLSHLDLVPTGRVKKHYGRRANVKVELAHEGRSPHTRTHCGYVFWTTHPYALDLLRKHFPERVESSFYSRRHVGGT